MTSVRIVVNSSPNRKPLQEVWKKCLADNWPDCPYPYTIHAPVNEGWNFNLIECLETVSEPFILMMLDDNWLEPSTEYTANIQQVIETMTKHPDIGMIKLHAGAAAAPEIEFPEWPRIREYDRRHHPFKRTNLVPCMYRREWLLRLSKAVLAYCGADGDRGRQGAIEFEVTGTLLTADASLWPERMFGIHRPEPGGGGGHGLLVCYANDAVTGGKVRPFLKHLCEGVQGTEVYL